MQTSTYPDDQVSKNYKSFANDHGQPLTHEFIDEVNNNYNIMIVNREH